jgi:hypothetical protein
MLTGYFSSRFSKTPSGNLEFKGDGDQILYIQAQTAERHELYTIIHTSHLSAYVPL